MLAAYYFVAREAMAMKASKYNLFFPYESDSSKMLAYNSLSNALALIQKEKYTCLMNFINVGCEIEDEKFVQQLKEGSFLINDEMDELAYLRHRMFASRYSNHALRLTIAPTSDCNFRCTYCYEKVVIRPDYMNDAVENEIIKMVEQRINSLKHLSVTWYGGEPLMAFDIVKRLSQTFISICDKNKIVYNAQMITNGYLLTPKIAKSLSDLKISLLQITLDGSAKTHNINRPLLDGSETFDTIIYNLIESRAHLPEIVVRINTDKDNINSGRDVFALLKEKNLADIVRPSLGKITENLSSLNSNNGEKKCLNTCDFSAIDFNYSKEITSNGSYIELYPRQVSNACGADRLNSYTIAADGNIYKCWTDIGICERVVGNLLEKSKKNYFTPLYFNYMLYDPTLDSKCSTCNLLPLCMGGCPYKRTIGDTDNCTKYKYILQDCLIHIVNNMQGEINKN